MAEGDLPPDYFASFADQPFNKYLGITLEEYRADFARMRLKISEQTPTGIGGSVNGGVIATLIDLVVIPAVFAGLKKDSTAGRHSRSAGDLPQAITWPVD